VSFYIEFRSHNSLGQKRSRNCLHINITESAIKQGWKSWPRSIVALITWSKQLCITLFFIKQQIERSRCILPLNCERLSLKTLHWFDQWQDKDGGNIAFPAEGNQFLCSNQMDWCHRWLSQWPYSSTLAVSQFSQGYVINRGYETYPQQTALSMYHDQQLWL